jgi:prephenate dehydrogenase
LLANRSEVLAQLSHFRTAVAAFESAMETGDAPALQLLIEQARDVRAAWALKADSD